MVLTTRGATLARADRLGSRLAEAAVLGHTRARRLACAVLRRAAQGVAAGRADPKVAAVAAAIHRALASGSRAAALPPAEVGAARPRIKLDLSKLTRGHLRLLIKLRATRKRYKIRARR